MLVGYSVLELHSVYEEGIGFTFWNAAVGQALKWSYPQPVGHWILSACCYMHWVCL